MNVVYCHIDARLGGFSPERYSSNDIPEYAMHSIRQTRFISPASNVFFICHRQNLSLANIKELDNLNVTIVEQDSLLTDKILSVAPAYSGCRCDKGLINFNFVTMIRLFFVEQFMRKYNMNAVFHMEYDNLLYQDLEDKISLFDGDYMCCKVNNDSICLGVSFFKTVDVLSKVNDQLIQLLRSNPKVYIAEMYLIAEIAKQNKDIKFFNWSPEDSEYIFDPNSYGIFICGTNQGNPQGFIDCKHDCGRFIAANISNMRFFRNNKEMCMLFHGKVCKFMNLHIHNKKAIPGMVTYDKI